jgi:hypothetical protein
MTRILFCNSWLDHQRIKDNNSRSQIGSAAGPIAVR